MRRNTLVIATMAVALALSAVGAAGANAACDTTVTAGDSIQTAVDNADPGDTICVRSGTYQEHVSIDKRDETVRRHPQPATDEPAEVDGSVSLDADGAELRLMAVTRTDDIEAPSPDAFAIRVRADDTVVAHNRVHSLEGESAD